MKTKQEQIEEMCEAIASMICQIYNPQCDEYEPHTCSHCYVNDTLIGDFAEMLYDAGYRKVPDGAVVLTPEERDDEMKATNEILAERDDLIAKVGVLGRENYDLKADNKQLKTECALLDDELRIARQETINVLNELKGNIKNAIDTYYNSQGGSYYSSEDVINDIDKMIKELVK